MEGGEKENRGYRIEDKDEEEEEEGDIGQIGGKAMSNCERNG
jgi:hypothetical protein